MHTAVEPQEKHAILSASSAERWLKCTPSAVSGLVYDGTYQHREKTRPEAPEHAQEGTSAHKLAELYLRHYLGHTTQQEFLEYYQTFKSCDTHYSKLMDDNISNYVAIVTQEIDKAKRHSENTIVLLEKRLDYSWFAPKGFGTADVVIICDGFVEIIDLKYGVGVPVTAQNNPQLRLYALGVYQSHEQRGNIKEVTLRVVQPRRNRNTAETLTVSELLAWAEDVVKPRAKLAWYGKGEKVTGEHCRFCPIKDHCDKRAEEQAENLNRDVIKLLNYATKKPSELTDEELGEVLDLESSGRLYQWIDELKSTAIERIEEHRDVPGWGITRKSRRKYVNEQRVISVLVNEFGMDIDTISQRKPLGVVKMEQTLGKEEFQKKLQGLVTKTLGKPTLAKDDR